MDAAGTHPEPDGTAGERGLTALDSGGSGGYPRAVTDAEFPTRESRDGAEPVPAGESPSQEVCPCCGLEMPAEALAGLITQLLPVVTAGQPAAAPEMAGD